MTASPDRPGEDSSMVELEADQADPWRNAPVVGTPGKDEECPI